MKALLCADLGGSRIKLGAFTESNGQPSSKPNGTFADAKNSKSNAARLLGKRIFDVGTTSNNLWLGKLEEQISTFLQEMGITELSGLAIAYAGPINCREKRLLPSNGKYLQANQIDLKAWAAKWTEKLIVDNDARLACVGEWQYGAGKGWQNLVCVTLGTGIGTSVVIGGRVLRGAHDLAGCLGGHFTVDYKGPRCSCGNIGCVEAVVSSDRFAELQEHLLRTDQKRVHSFAEAFRAAKTGDPNFIELQNQVLQTWGSAIVSYIHAYDPECVVLSGGIMDENGDFLLAELRKYVDENAWQPHEKVRLLKGYTDEAALYGGLYLLEKGEESVTL